MHIDELSHEERPRKIIFHLSSKISCQLQLICEHDTNASCLLVLRFELMFFIHSCYLQKNSVLKGHCIQCIGLDASFKGVGLVKWNENEQATWQRHQHGFVNIEPYIALREYVSHVKRSADTKLRVKTISRKYRQRSRSIPFLLTFCRKVSFMFLRFYTLSLGVTKVYYSKSEVLQ